MGGQPSNMCMRAEPTIPHQPPPTLAEQKQRIPAWLSKQLSVAFGRMTIDEGDLWSVFGSYLSVIFPVERGFMIGSPLSLPPVAGMQAGVPAVVICKASPFDDHPSGDRIVSTVAFQRDDTNYAEAAHQLIHFMDTAHKRNRDQALEFYLLVGYECLVFKTGPGSQRVDVSRTHGPILNIAGTGFLTTEMCRLARDYWNWGL